jgi:hypothetical protein
VPTPTGTLQGAAAFSWDATTWQPSGRAYSSVATPTGVLRGVAPFSWDGSAWQPSGLARPGVPTPTGTLDGIALYAWSGTAWTPAGGAPDVPTPSGTLQGVAAFSWDGTAWQPSGQAAPEVATPAGVLAGMAMFSWNGTGWAPTVSPAALDLNFLTMAPTLDPRITFTRASTATYFDSTGTMQTAATNAPRWDYNPSTHALNGLLIEEARTNLLLNSAALGTQSVAVTAQAYTLSFYGTGTVTMSGAFAGTLVGTGTSPARVSTTFTPAAGTLTCTVTGSVVNAQLEAGGFATSYIPTIGATVTRAQDVCAIPPANMGFFVSPGGSWDAEFIVLTTAPGNLRVLMVLPYLAGSFTPAFVDSFWHGGQYSGTSALNVTNAIAPGVIAKLATTSSATTQQACVNGGPVASAALTGGYPSAPANGIGFMQVVGQPTDSMTGYIRRVRYWPRVLSNAELQQVTT